MGDRSLTRSIHGDKSQNQRQRALSDFKECKIAVLVATDIAARGIDISELPLVINFDLPNIPESRAPSLSACLTSSNSSCGRGREFF